MNSRSPDFDRRVAWRRHALAALQIAVSALLLWLIGRKLDLPAASRAAAAARPELLMAGVAALMSLQLVGAWRWRRVAHALGVRIRLRHALPFVWIGALFGQALPASVGGDGVRMWLLWRAAGAGRAAVHSVLVERTMMVIVLAAVATGSLVFSPTPLLGSATAWMSTAGAIAMAGGGAVLWMMPRSAPAPGQRSRLPAVHALLADVRSVCLAPARAAPIVALCLAAYALTAGGCWFIARALGLDLALHQCIAIMPLVILAGTVPISIGGWGVREGAMVALLARYGIAPADAFTLSVLFGLAGLAASMPGLAFWLSLPRTLRHRAGQPR